MVLNVSFSIETCDFTDWTATDTAALKDCIRESLDAWGTLTDLEIKEDD